MNSSKRFSLSILGLVLGLAIGTTATAFVGGAVAYVSLKRGEVARKKALSPVRVIVAARDIAPGEVVTYDAIAQREIPGAIVTASLVLPDSASFVVGQPVTAPIRTGDPIAWTFFLAAKAKAEDGAVVAACNRARQAMTDQPKPLRTAAEIRQALLSGEIR